jgi:hypothetical protein
MIELQFKYIFQQVLPTPQLNPKYAYIKIKIANTSIAAKRTQMQAQRVGIKMK